MPKPAKVLTREDIIFLYRMLGEALKEMETGTAYRRKTEADSDVAFRLLKQYSKRIGIDVRHIWDILMCSPIAIMDGLYPVDRTKPKRKRARKA